MVTVQRKNIETDLVSLLFSTGFKKGQFSIGLTSTISFKEPDTLFPLLCVIVIYKKNFEEVKIQIGQEKPHQCIIRDISLAGFRPIVVKLNWLK